MKTFFALLAIFSGLFLSAQEETPLERLYLSEMNAAASIMNFRPSVSMNDYDVTHYKLELTADPGVSGLNGVVTTSFTALSPMSSITFALDDVMIVSSVTRNGSGLSFVQNANNELIVQFGNTIPTGQSASVAITYFGNPASSGFGSYERTTHNGTPIVWTLSEPYGAMTWWPCKQNLTDKADSLDVYITSPSAYTAVSNGVMEGETVNGSLKTAHWDHDYPIPAYLVAFAVTNYAKYTTVAGSGANTFPFVNYVYPENLSYIQTQTPITLGIMDFYENTFEPYPYNDEKYGHCQFGWGGGMEHTTISFMGGFSRGLIAHELAHQWFGDKITCGSWQDIWLNEGFATYLSGMIIDHFDGAAAFQNWREDLVSYIVSQPGGSVYVPAPDTLNVGRIFSSRLTYDKGALVLHMLRKKLGDATFFQGVQNYLSDPNLAYGFASTPDLESHIESASGLNLDEFFSDWIYKEGYPSYTIYWHQNPNNDVVLTFTQTQSHPSVSFFEAPVSIRFNGTNNSIEKTFFNTSNGQQFTEPIPFNVVSLEIDPYSDLISKNNSAVLKQKDFEKTGLIFYPNPVGNKLYFEKPASLKINSAKIIDLLGRIVGEFETISSGFIPTAGLKTGLYIVILDTSEGRVHEKIVKSGVRR